MIPFSRRQFLFLTGGAFLGTHAMAVEPFKRPGAARLKLSLAAYSFRDYFKDATHPQKPVEDKRIGMTQFIDYCAEHGCAGAELTSYYFPKDVSDDQLREVRRHAFLRGIAISGTSVGNNFVLPKGEERDKQIAMVKKWIDRAAVLGAPHIRVFAGSAPKGMAPDEARRLCIEALEECCDYAGARGIFLGMENHGGIVTEPAQLLDIVRSVKSPWLGINLDTGNFRTADPYAALAECAPYAVNVQLKAEIQPAASKASVPADLARLTRILSEANYQGWVALEYESKENPWTGVPPLLAKLRELFAESKSPAAAASISLFDGKTLNGWKVTDFGGHGGVAVEDGTIVLDAGNDLTGINYTGEVPKTNYEVELEAKRISGSDFFCALTVPVGDSHCTLVAGGWGGALVGVSSIDGMDASENSTTQVMKFDAGRWYAIRMRVTPAKIEAWIDKEQMVNLEIEGKKISMRPGEIEMSKPFGLASFQTRAAYRGIKITKL